MRSALDVVKKQLILILLVLGIGLAAGVPLGWATVRVVNTTPAVLREDLQEDYLRMAIDSFRVNRDPNLAIRRWDDLGAAASEMFSRIQRNPDGIDPVVVVAFGEVIQAVKGTSAAEAAAAVPDTTQPESPYRNSLVFGSVAALILVAIAGGTFVARRFVARKRTVRAAEGAGGDLDEAVPQQAKTDFGSLGVASPIAQNMTTYVLGDDLYDESFSIDTPGGDFLGEYGVGVSETIGVGEPKKVAALEIWLFDKNDIKTATKVLMSHHAFEDAGTRTRLEAKGELILVEPKKQVMLETETLQLLATIIDLQFGDGSMPERSYFDRVTLELAVWRKTG